jgi:hypothetical protein
MVFGLSPLALGVIVLGVCGAVALAVAYVYQILRADDPEAEAEAVGESLGERVTTAAGILWRVPATLFDTLLYAVTRVVPFFGTKWWKVWATVALHRYHKKAGGDAIALKGNDQSSKAELAPVKYDEGLDDQEDQPGWRVKGEDRTFAPAHAGGPIRLGKTPILPINEDERRVGSWLECNVTEAIADGQMAELYEVESADLRATIDYGPGAGGQPAVSDGGMNVTDMEFEPRESPIFKDTIIDLTSPQDYDGRAMSWWKYADHDPTKTTPEALDNAEQRGLLAGLAGHDNKDMIVKIMLIAAGCIIGGIAAPHLPEIVRIFAGGGGGGGGGSSGGAGGFLFWHAKTLVGVLG